MTYTVFSYCALIAYLPLTQIYARQLLQVRDFLKSWPSSTTFLRLKEMHSIYLSYDNIRQTLCDVSLTRRTYLYQNSEFIKVVSSLLEMFFS